LGDDALFLLGRCARPGTPHGEARGLLEVDVRQDLFFRELERLLLVARRELLVALDRGEHLVGDLLDELVGGDLLCPGIQGERRAGEESEDLAHAVAFSFWLEPLNMPGSSEWRSSRR